jgi:molybdopterin-containing oxidoreductase family membrane subunit
MAVCNCIIPLVLFSPRVRRNLWLLFVISLFINLGMWLERFVIFAGSLTTNFDPSQWAFYAPRPVEIAITVGTFAWFLMWFSLFSRFMPIVSMTEVKEGVKWLKQALKETVMKAAA